MRRTPLAFFILSGRFGFTLSFILATFVAPNLPVFVFVVIISTMPVITLCGAAVLRVERPTLMQVVAIVVGFAVAVLVATEAVRIPVCRVGNGSFSPSGFRFSTQATLCSSQVADRMQ